MTVVEHSFVSSRSFVLRLFNLGRASFADIYQSRKSAEKLVREDTIKVGFFRIVWLLPNGSRGLCLLVGM